MISQKILQRLSRSCLPKTPKIPNSTSCHTPQLSAGEDELKNKVVPACCGPSFFILFPTKHGCLGYPPMTNSDGFPRSRHARLDELLPPPWSKDAMQRCCVLLLNNTCLIMVDHGCWMLLDVAGCCWILLDVAGCCWMLLVFFVTS